MKPNPLSTVRRELNKRAPSRSGITGPREWKFFAALLLQFASMVFFLRDPWFGKVMFLGETSLTLAVVALVLLAAFAWEECLFGPPAGANLLLQLTLLVPFYFYLYRIVGISPIAPVSGLLPEAVHQFVAEHAWRPISEIFDNPALLLVILTLMFALCFRSRTVRIGTVGLPLFYFTVRGFTLDGGSAVFYLPAVGCLCAALALQYCPYDRIVLYGNIKRALDIETDPAGYRAMLKIAVECCKHGELGEEGVLHLVREEYPSAEGEELRRTAAGLLSRLIHRHRLLELVSDGNGFRLVPNPGIRRVSSPLAGVAQVPRVVFALLLAVLWMLSPIDLIPDAVPLFGVVDDVGVTLLTAGLLFRNRRDAGN